MLIPIEIRYANLTKQKILQLNVADHLSLESVISLAYTKLKLELIDLDLNSVNIGINGIKAKDHQIIVKAYDLVEFYQPLLIDPKQLRKLKVKRKK